MISGRTECDHPPIPFVRNGRECLKVKFHDMPAWNIAVQYVRGGGGKTVHGKGVKLPQAADNIDPLTGLWSGT